MALGVVAANLSVYARKRLEPGQSLPSKTMRELTMGDEINTEIHVSKRMASALSCFIRRSNRKPIFAVLVLGVSALSYAIGPTFSPCRFVDGFAHPNVASGHVQG